MEPGNKKPKLQNDDEEENEITKIPQIQTCKFFVQRKKRFCKMTVSEGKEYCGEHSPAKTDDKHANDEDRIPCPLDPKHTVYRKNLRKHLKICNARPQVLPEYIIPGLNSGTDDEADEDDFKLCDVDRNKIEDLIARVENFYNTNVKHEIEEFILEHDVLQEEIQKAEYGHTTRKHLQQTSSMLSYLKHFNLLKDSTSFIEFGSGKGLLSYWLSKAISSHKNSQIIPLDRASLRHKKDNKVDNLDITVKRIRADIRDFDITKLDLIKATKYTVGISKHLCGEATDLALRAMLPKTVEPQVEGFLIAFCCHHRCFWKPFFGKTSFINGGFNKEDFKLITKMASWAICGSGYSREKRKRMEEKERLDEEHFKTDDDIARIEEAGKETLKISVERRTEIGRMCKRILDYCRVQSVLAKGYECFLRYYTTEDITLENACIIARKKETELNVK